MARNSDVVPMDESAQAAKSVATITDRALLERFAEMAVAIPADMAEGTEEILRTILSAVSWEDVNKPWDVSDVADILGKHLHVTSVTRRPSTFQGGLGMFLVIKLYDPKTKKEHVKTTSSVSVVGQFASLFFLGATAITIEWCRSERPTKAGYYPEHILVIDAHVPARDGAATK